MRQQIKTILKEHTTNRVKVYMLFLKHLLSTKFKVMYGPEMATMEKVKYIDLPPTAIIVSLEGARTRLYVEFFYPKFLNNTVKCEFADEHAEIQKVLSLFRYFSINPDLVFKFTTYSKWMIKSNDPIQIKNCFVITNKGKIWGNPDVLGTAQ